jgi:hypothetical protein
MNKDISHGTGDYPLATDDFAAKNFVKPQSVRKRLALTGSYHGVRPRKLKNRRLAWPDVQV